VGHGKDVNLGFVGSKRDVKRKPAENGAANSQVEHWEPQWICGDSVDEAIQFVQEAGSSAVTSFGVPRDRFSCILQRRRMDRHGPWH
jgi:hypothetical protein